MKLTSSQSWKRNHKVRDISMAEFSEVISRKLSNVSPKSLIEIGAYPGRFLSFAAKHFTCHVEGIDYVSGSKDVTEKMLKQNGVEDFKFYEEDFFKWTPERKYDVVTSFGFVEHFTGETNNDAIKRHIDLLSDDGHLILTVPNLRWFRHLKYFIFNKDILDRHNLKTMSLSYFRRIAEEHNLEIVYLKYHGGGLIGTIRKMIERLIMKKNNEDIVQQKNWEECLNDRFFSSSIIFIAKKSASIKKEREQ